MKALTAAVLMSLLLACFPRGGPKTRVPGEGEVKVVACSEVVAHFAGEMPEAEGGEFPAEYGIDRLWFELPNRPSRSPFVPLGSLSFSDWEFEVFSPDCHYVLLPQDRFGPYDVVLRRKLAAYLDRKAPPHQSLRIPSESAIVHCGARWVSSQDVELKGCGETGVTERIRIH
jgi:hypothetical protein